MISEVFGLKGSLLLEMVVIELNISPKLDVRSQPLRFSKDVNNEQLAQWLRNHSSLTGIDYEEDISKLSGTCCNLITMLVITINIFI